MHTFSLQTRLYSGPGSLAALQRFSHQHIWIVCDGFLARSPLLDRLRAALPASNRVSVFSDITPDPTIHTVAKGIAQMQALLTAVETLKQQCAIPTLKGALQEKYPLFLSRIPAMVPAALTDATLRTNPRPVDGAAIAQLLENLQ
ncbi:TPA: iron-containing alcohol dehydrogenase [Klebsiella pneumoniae]|nr:iron-containing alcohol dehydrogenase [Klebsiella pneumoniae]